MFIKWKIDGNQTCSYHTGVDPAIRMQTKGSFYKKNFLNYVELAGPKAGVWREKATYKIDKVLKM